LDAAVTYEMDRTDLAIRKPEKSPETFCSADASVVVSIMVTAH
jgi:hypothetical protein